MIVLWGNFVQRQCLGQLCAEAMFEVTLCTGNVWGNFVYRPCLRQLCAQAMFEATLCTGNVWGNFVQRPCCLWGIKCGWTWSPCSPCSSPSDIRKATCPGDVAVVWGTFVYSFYFTCYEHKLWTYTSFHCLHKLILNSLIMKFFFDCCCFTVVKWYKHLMR